MQFLFFNKGVLEIRLRVLFQEFMENISIFFMLHELLNRVVVEFPLSKVSLEFLLDIFRVLITEMQAHNWLTESFLQEILFECTHKISDYILFVGLLHRSCDLLFSFCCVEIRIVLDGCTGRLLLLRLLEIAVMTVIF